mmetsp:Transcript_10584/g.11865  ORF Transcript_10584/g.11865 Transcript_10584/m.11865 type:complete len:125 (+) Transcript_10584:263-637(+)
METAVVGEITMAIEMEMIAEIIGMITPLFLAAVTALIVITAVTMDMILVATTIIDSTATEITTTKCLPIVLTTGGRDMAEDTVAITTGMSMVKDTTPATGMVTAVDTATATIITMEDITTITTT